jgi:hypothetical protein
MKLTTTHSELGFRVPFSTIFRGLPRKSADRLENAGRQEANLLQVYVPLLCWLYPLKPSR